jgi:DNA-directed RNA polymerase subunit RPC12/RpoP
MRHEHHHEIVKCNECGKEFVHEKDRLIIQEKNTRKKLKNAQCKRCLNKFQEKGIYTIQQFQYRKTPSYDWTKEFFHLLKIDEWDSFCEDYEILW